MTAKKHRAIVSGALLNIWHRKLQNAARKKGYAWLIQGAEDHRSGFEEGLTVYEELESQIDSARRT